MSEVRSSGGRQPGWSGYEPSFSGGTSIRTEVLSIAEAARRVVAGQMGPLELYSQLPPPLTGAINNASQAAFGKDFTALSSHEQKTLFGSLLSAMKESSIQLGSASPPVTPALPTPKPKSWWKFWG